MNTTLTTRIAALLIAAGAFNVTLHAHADCAAASVADVKRRYASAQQLDRAGKMRDALAAYAAAQEATCEANPVAAAAAQRGAEIALPLGQSAEKSNDHEAAFLIYDDGGLYTASDRALMAFVRANPDKPQVFSRAREVLEYRSSEAFQSNNKQQLGITGAYRADSKNLDEVRRMPAVGVERAFGAEMKAWNEQYLRELADQLQTRPEDLADIASVQRYTAAQGTFARKWPNDLLKESRDAISLATAWAYAANDAALAKKVETQRLQRLEMRAHTLTKSFHRAPLLLEAAIDYQMMQDSDDASKAGKAKAIRQQAAQLGDQAQAQRRYLLASDYYRVADLDDKASAAQEQSQQLAMAKMQPNVDQMRKQAEEMQKAYGDPAKVKAMQQQALEAQKAIRAQQQANAKNGSGKSAAELEKELGL